MKSIALFNNKGGVGKTTLAFHLSSALSILGKKVLMVDLDPQCNLTICGMQEESLHKIWGNEDPFIDDFEESKQKTTDEHFNSLYISPRTIHFLLKPTEEGYSDPEYTPPAYRINKKLHLIPGRLTMHMYENKIAERWSGTYQGDPLSIRTITQVRNICENYAKKYSYDFVIIDTSPSLGVLNKVIISTVDGFIIPCLPDMFSLYGIRNIGDALSKWKKEFDTIYSLISDPKRNRFPESFVRFLGFTIYNARKYNGVTKWDLAIAHYNYAKQIPKTIFNFISKEVRKDIPASTIRSPIGKTSVMHSHNTLPNMTQKYKCPIWAVPQCELEAGDKRTIVPNRKRYEETKGKYIEFAKDLLDRLEYL